jgi:hypothetical protein
MPDTVADVLVRLGVDTSGMRAGFRDARAEASRFASDLAGLLSASLGGRPGNIAGAAARAAGSVVPGPVGFVLRGVGSLFGAIGSFFSGLFKRAAQRTAAELRKTFQEILHEFNAGSATLGESIRRLEQERGNAIRRLSGKKGGRDELKKLLPEFDRALDELRARQQAIFQRFEESLALLRVGSAFRDVAAEVRALIRQYREYVDAGGDLARANEFLSLSLANLREQSAIELAEAEERAIRDALRLNDLLRERQELVAQTEEDERRIRSRGVLERQRTVAQDKAAEIEAVRRRRDERLAELDQQIQLLQLKVDIESRVFDLTQDRVALEMRLLELKAREFERDTARLAALKDVLAGIVPGAGGLSSVAPALQQQLNLGPVQIVVGQNATPAEARAAGAEVIEGMMRAWMNERARLGLAV